MDNLTIIIILVIVVLVLFKLLMNFNEEKKLLKSSKQSLSVKHGMKVEQFAPFFKNFKYNPSDCHFLGKPIDYIIFDEDNEEIILLEVKTENSRLTKREAWIKEAIGKKKVYFKEFRI